MKITSLFTLGMFLILLGCRQQEKEPMEFQQEGYALSYIDTFVNQTYEVQTLSLGNDYDGPVEATLLKRPMPDSVEAKKAVLYIHGYSDYFFQTHMADWYAAQGYQFYALELRKYGRSLRPYQKPNYARKMQEYYPEINQAIQIITEKDGFEGLTLMGHSTGGLTSSLYAHEGMYRDRIERLVLNSPFFAFKGGGGVQRSIRFAAWVGSFNKNGEVPRESKGLYGYTIHEDHQGEWPYNLVWKPMDGFPLYFAWVRAIHKGHQQVKQGLAIQCPVLVLSSDKSFFGTQVEEAAFSADAVLDVESMHTRAQGLGEQVDIIPVENAMHDVFLSRKPARTQAFEELGKWLDTH